MAERQIRHRKSRLVLSARFPFVNDVPVLLLNQPNIPDQTKQKNLRAKGGRKVNDDKYNYV